MTNPGRHPTHARDERSDSRDRRPRPARPWRRPTLLLRRYFRANTPRTIATGALRLLSRVSLRAVVISVSLLLVVSITIAVLTAIALARDTPRWWRQTDFNTPQTRELARKVEVAIVERVHQPRDEDNIWRVSIDVEQANAWLNAKLPAWVESRELDWPDKVAQVQADFNNGTITLGARLNKDAASQIVAASFQLEVRDDGALWIRQPRAQAGRLDLPRGWTVARLREWLPPELENSEAMNRVLVALAGDGPLFEQARLKLGDGRLVRMLSITSSDNHLLIEAVTERSAASASADETGDDADHHGPHAAPELTPQPMVDGAGTPGAPPS
ncbi:MAG: hypothetical protein H6813_04160 [Phycisphaeraceae bacterium]|nr:hypothetical protein [Phycisphaeraceae bacterium]MCB9847141.1 hypothetical protein [Phycisphaeraceae bacterium]